MIKVWNDILKKARDLPPSVSGEVGLAFAVSLADYTTFKLPNWIRFVICLVKYHDLRNHDRINSEHSKLPSKHRKSVQVDARFLRVGRINIADIRDLAVYLKEDAL